MDYSRDLHNNHNVYILGAGFSRLRGLPLIGDFMVMMRDALQYHSSLGHQRECKAIEAVLEFRLRASSAAYRVQIDLENIEELFSLASASTSQMEDSIRLAIAATLDYANETAGSKTAQFNGSEDDVGRKNGWLFNKSQFDESRGSWIAPAYSYIVRSLLGHWDDVGRSSENTFITLNYDTVLEDALGSLGVSYSLGFDERSKSKDSSVVEVLKLHGSVNWTIPKGARTKIDVLPDYRAVVDAGLTPQLIPPTWKKDSRGAFNDIWDRSLRALTGATRVVVIGFSIPATDQHFKYLLAAGLQENYSLREIVFVNPEIEMVKERCQNLFSSQAYNPAKLRFVASSLEAFTGQGTSPECISSISRPIPTSVQTLRFL